MPNANAKRPAADPQSVPPSAPIADKDRVGEEMADDARIWRVYDQIARADDKERISAWNRGLDNLALFAGLFSAVTTAFIIEAQKDMKVDYSQLAFLALNATANGVPFPQQPFVIPSGARTITCLWVSSLLLSLSAALIAIMGKDWIGMYAARPVCNARQWAEMRTYRLLCVERWYVSQVIASAPVLLHISLLLFGAGLVQFISSDPLTHQLALGLALAAGSLYLINALSAILFPAIPFKSPATQILRGGLAKLLRSACDLLLYFPKRHPIAKVHVAISRIIAPDLNEISRMQRRSLLLSPNLFHHQELPRSSLMDAARTLLHLVRDSACTALLSAWVASRYFLVQSTRHIQLANVASAFRYMQIGQRFVGSPWTDIRSHSSPVRLANALSWLHDSSLEPEVLGAIIMALGDIEVGGQVARLVSGDLRTRVRADIRFNWQKVDFYTLSRYVLADRNLPADPVITYQQFLGRFSMERNPHLRCEDGLAAVVLAQKPYRVSSSTIERYCPRVVSQPRMFSLLLPHVASSGWESLVTLGYLYRESLDGRVLRDMEAAFAQSFYPDICDSEGYDKTVRDKFGGQSGPLELLTYLIIGYPLLYTNVLASAGELILHILTRFSSSGREHWCIAYLFSELSRSLWDYRSLTPWEAGCLLDSLPLWTYCQYKWNDSDAPLEYGCRRAVEHAVAWAIVEILSPRQWGRGESLAAVQYRSTNTSHDDLAARFLHAQLCHSRSLLTEDEKVALIGHMLERTALWWLQFPVPDLTSPPEYPHKPECCVGIISAIVYHLTRLLRSDDVQGRGIELFGLLAHHEFPRKDGGLGFWNLGDYLQYISGRISEHPPIQRPRRRPGVVDKNIAAPAVRRLIAALQSLHPLCRASDTLLKHWNRIGLPDAVENWKFETESELVALLSKTRQPERKARSRVRRVLPRPGGGNERDAVWWLDASMM